MYDEDMGYLDDDVELINDLDISLATGSDVQDSVYFAETSVASVSDWQVLHHDIQSLHWSVLCIYCVVMFLWICKQWG